MGLAPRRPGAAGSAGRRPGLLKGMMLGCGPGYGGAENPPGDVFSFEQGVAWLSLKETSLEQYTSR